MTKTIETRTHYFEDDTSFLGDYAEVCVLVDGEEVVRYGDASHERGRERADGFVSGLLHAWGPDNVTLSQTRVADYS